LVNDNWNDASTSKQNKGKDKEVLPRLSPEPWECCGEIICICGDNDFPAEYSDEIYDINNDQENNENTPWDEQIPRERRCPKDWETWSEESKELYHFCKMITEQTNASRAYDQSRLNEYGVPLNAIYQPTKEEVESLFSANIKIKQVIAGQPILRGGSQCDFSCDTENHHIHTYCKMCQQNLPYGTTIHRCKFGFGLGQIHPDMDPKFLVNNLWWKEPHAVIEENNIIYLDAFIRLCFNQIPEVEVAPLD